MSQASSDFDGPLLDDGDLVDSGFDDSGFADSSFGDGLDAGDLGEAEGWDGEAEVPMAPGRKAASQKKQGFSVYTVMLIMAFVFLTVASIFLFLEVGRLK